MNTTIPDARSAAVDESLYLAIFRVTAIADLAGPVRAVEWAQSLLDDEQLRAAFISGVSSEWASRTRESEEPGGAVHAFGDRRAASESSPNLLAGGRPRFSRLGV